LPSLREIWHASPFDRLNVRRIALQSGPIGVIHVVTVITAKGEIKMTELTAETAAAQAPASSEKPKVNKKARVARQGAHVAPKKAKSGKKASPGKKTPKAAKKVAGARVGSKTAKVLELLNRPNGATLKELMKATGWQAHSVRGFLSGTVGKKMGLTVKSAKSEDSDRSYSVKS
jgi:Protein of unknown function (DUF3489)